MNAIWDIWDHHGFLPNAVDAELSVQVILSKPETFLAFDDLEILGFCNPFSRDSYLGFVNKREIDIAHIRESEVEVDPTTGRRDILTTAGMVVEDRLPGTGEVSQSLGDWRVITDGDDFDLRLRIPLDSVDHTTLLEEPRWYAMLLWLRNSLRVTGTAWDIASGLPVSATYEYEIEQSDTETTRFRVIGTSSGPTKLTIDCRRITTSGGTTYPVHDRDLINAILDDTDVVTPVTTAREKPPFGGETAHSTAQRRYFDEDTYLERQGDYLNYRGLELGDPGDPDTRRSYDTWVGAPYGRILEVESLLTNNAGYYKMPKLYNVIGLHYSGTVVANLRLDTPANLLENPGDTWNVFIHNGGTARLHVHAPNNDPLVTLEEGERLPLHIIRRADGSGEITTDGRFERRLSHHGDSPQVINTKPYVVDSDSRYYRPVPRLAVSGTDDGEVYRNVDTFGLGGGLPDWSDGDSLGSADLLDLDSVTVEKAGWLRIEWSVTIRGASGGNIPSNQGIELHRQANNNNKTRLRSDLKRQFNPNDSDTFSIITELQIPAAGRNFLFLYSYPSTVTMPLGSAQFSQYSLDMILEHEVDLQF